MVWFGWLMVLAFGFNFYRTIFLAVKFVKTSAKRTVLPRFRSDLGLPVPDGNHSDSVVEC